MPKFPKSFGRRRSSGNVLEDVQAEPSAAVEHSFKVFERPDGASRSFDGGVKLAKASTSYTPSNLAPRPKTTGREENMFEGIINGNRSASPQSARNNRPLTLQSGSGASNSNSASTTDNSSRLSAASTAPSSTNSKSEEWKSHDKPSGGIPLPPVPKSQSTFSLKAAGRSLSWGRNKQNNTPPPPPPLRKDTPSPPPNEYQGRQRAVTASSYASTATPPKLDERELGLSLGGDFGDMFSSFGKRKSQMLEAERNRAMSKSPELPPSGPASRSQTTSRLNVPTPLHLDKNKDIESAPYSWGTQHSNDGLMANPSPPPFSPRNDENLPPVPQHSTPLRRPVNNPPSTLRQNTRPPLADAGIRRNSGYTGRRQSTAELDLDEDAKLLRESIVASKKLNAPNFSPHVRDSWAIPPEKAYKVDDATIATWSTGSVNTTPKAQRAPLPQDDSMFDNETLESASLAQKFEETIISLPKSAAASKVMTPAQFERYKQDQERMRSVGGKTKDEEDDDEEEDTYEEEEDEAEKNRQLAKQRRKQEAHMAVYRQQMMKVTGETPSTGSFMSSGKSSSLGNRPSFFATQSSPNLSNLGSPEEGEEEDEEVPLAILQAHGFPNKNKPPMRSSGSNPNLRAQAAAGGALPVFARHLPQDPYLGAGLVQPMYRESMAFGGGGSVHGSPSRGVPPGGLVGVIATEERSRAMRRGSPNAQGDFGPQMSGGMNGFNGMGMPPNMMNGMGPTGMGMPMPMMQPGDPMAAQMQQMQEFMRVQMQFMQMMSQGGTQNGSIHGGPPQSPQQDFLRPSSAHGPTLPQMLHPGGSHQRAMSMLDPNAAPWMQQSGQGGFYAPSTHGQGGYAPSIAPSERSNIGLPGRYRPVSHAPQPSDTKSRASTMTGALGGWEAKNSKSTVKIVNKSGNASDEDDEEGWEEMVKKRQEKRSLWKSKAKKDSNTNGLKELLGYSQ
ncbi:hypothetical protein B0O99DRAFT_647688 [Bisporella sp. PMI_857]|nr:hypothetical protein B0O99DRAFT_647688 [Bisporella sp. PMI_857]